MHRAVALSAAACAVALAWGTGTGVVAQVTGAQVIHVAEFADTPLREFHNALYRSPADHIVDDHGVRMGSLGSDIYQSPDDSYNEFWAVTDRGPNGNPGRRTFVTPTFNPVIMHVRVQADRVHVIRAIPILDASGLPVTGLSNVPGFDEVPYNFNGTNLIASNPNGLDTEGLVRTRGGEFWLVDEYSPSLVHLGPDGRVIDRFVPVDSQLGNTLATTPNYRVKKYLPKILNYRRQNRGFEGLALSPDEKTLFLAMQSPLDYPTSALGRASRNVRLLAFDISAERVTGEYVYHLDEVCAFLGRPAACGVAPGEMKISGLVALSATSLLVEERTDTVAKVYKVDVAAARNILNTAWDDVAPAPVTTTPALETLSAPASAGIAVLPKVLVVDLSTLPGIPGKIEGLALARGNVLVVANDNDFGMVDNASFDALGRLSSDTRAKSQFLFIRLASPLR